VFILQVLAVAVYNHYKRIYHASLQKGLVSYAAILFTLFFALPNNIILLLGFNTRLGAESGIPDGIDNDDNVELEKSNVLLMGPTGSGMIITICS
jgi:ATP-dependent Clp protease ATP-binding subunit ClpX